MNTFIQDLRYAIRSLIRTPGFTVIAVVALALGIGANTALFSVVNAVLLKPLPYRTPERLVAVWEQNFIRGRDKNVVSPGNFLHWQDDARAFEAMAAVVEYRPSVTGGGEPEEVPGQVVTASIFPLLGVPARLGRTFLPQEDTPGNDRVALLSHRLWQRRFGGDRTILGRAVMLGGNPHTVVGVMPAKFTILDAEADVWVPFGFPAEARTPRGRYLRVLGRLKPGNTVAAAQAEMNTIAERLRKQFPEFNTGWGVTVIPLHEEVVGDVRPALMVLFGAVGFVLLIACANVASLLLVRGSGRQRELAVRTALGAGRARLVRQLLTESMLLGTLGGVLGLGLAVIGINALLAALTDRFPLPRVSEIGIDPTVLGFTLLVSLATSAVFGLAPALEASAPDLNVALKDASRGATAGRTSRRLRGALVVAEIALALVLLVGAALLMRSFIRLQQVDPGFRSKNVLTMGVQLPRSRYPEDHQRLAFFDQLLQRIGGLPGVRAAGGISFLPFVGMGAATSFAVTDRPEPPQGERPVADVRAVSGNYFKAMGIRLLRGRLFTSTDAGDASHVAVINQTMVRQFWPDQDPIGKRVAVNWDEGIIDEIVGVVADVKPTGFDSETRPMIYWPLTRVTYSGLALVVSTEGDPLLIADEAAAAVRALDPDLPVAAVRTLDAVLAESVSRPRLNTFLLGTFAAIALVLAAVGIYGVMAYTVTQRTQEIGIRMALGAGQGDVLRLLLSQGLTLAIAGVAAGLAGSLMLTRLMSSLLFDTNVRDPGSFAAVAALLTTVALMATWIPARRATRLDPTAALRNE